MGSPKRCCSKRELIEALATVQQAVAIAAQHLEPGHEVVAKGDGLCRLEVGEAGHDGVGIGFGQIRQGGQQLPLLVNKPSIADRKCKRMSVATWSLRERPV